MKKHLFYSLLMLISLMGCNSPKGNADVEEVEEGLPVINLYEGVEEVDQLNLSDAADHVEVVKLETTNKNLINFIEGVEVAENDIFVANGGRYLQRFSREGKYLNDVGKQGQGPGEYTWMHKFYIDTDHQIVYILTASNGVYIYDYDGMFIRKATDEAIWKMFDDSPYCGLVVYKNHFMEYKNLGIMRSDIPADSLWSIAIVDSAFQKQSIFKNPAHRGREEELLNDENHPGYLDIGIGPVNYYMEFTTSIDFINDEITFKLPDTDTIYVFSDASQSLEPQYAIETGEVKGSYELMHRWLKERRAFDYFSIYSYHATPRYIYLVGCKGEEIYTFAYDRLQRTTRLVKRQGIITTNDRFVPIYGRPLLQLRRDFLLTNDFTGSNFKVDYRSQGKYWIQALEVGDSSYEEFVTNLKASPAAPQKQQLLDVIAKTGEEDNPILLIAVLK